MAQEISSNPKPTVEIPEDIICPITGQIMTDPVVLVETGHSYEREAILKWFEKNNTDPSTNVKIASKMIAPNITVKKMIVSFIEKNKSIKPGLIEDTYLPESLVKSLIESIQKNDSKAFKEFLGKDTRLLSKDLEDNKNLLMLGCESASLEILTIIIEKLGSTLLKLPCVSKDKGLPLFLIVSRRLGLEGVRMLSTAFNWGLSDFQSFLNITIENNDLPLGKIALSLVATTLSSENIISKNEKIISELEKKLQDSYSKISQLEKALQESSDRETKIKFEFQEYQKQVNQQDQQKSSVDNFSMWNSSSSQIPPSTPVRLSIEQKIKQDELIKFLSEGNNLKDLKNLESTGISFVHPSRDGVYPLVAAVYAMDREVVMYIESKLSEEDNQKQWSEVDKDKALEKIKNTLPTELMKNATYGELEEWYKTNAEKGKWCREYDKACLERENILRDEYYITVDLYTQKESKYKQEKFRGWYRRWEKRSMSSDSKYIFRENKYYSGNKRTDLIFPSRKVHDEVIKPIRDQLYELKEDVEIKAGKQPVINTNRSQNSFRDSYSNSTTSRIHGGFFPSASSAQSGYPTSTSSTATTLSSTLVQQATTLKQDQLQDQLIAALLKGELEEAKKFESQGASLLHPNKEGIYPLVAAVYGANLELVRYVEGKLKGETSRQWLEVDRSKALEKLSSQMPTDLPKNATYGDLGNWYLKHQGASWCVTYDSKVLRTTNCKAWGSGDGGWGEKGRAVVMLDKRYYDRPLENDVRRIAMNVGGLYSLSVEVHDNVVKTIREQLNELKREVEAKAGKLANLQTNSSSSSSSVSFGYIQ